MGLGLLWGVLCLLVHPRWPARKRTFALSLQRNVRRPRRKSSRCQVLRRSSDFSSLGGGDWLAQGCGKCWKVTGTSNIPGYSGMETTMVLKGTNFCPDANPMCSKGPHFDIAAPGFDVLAYSFAHVCPQREPEEAAGFAACGEWLIKDTNPDANCDCSLFNSPILRAGCENFYSLKWDNP